MIGVLVRHDRATRFGLLCGLWTLLAGAAFARAWSSLGSEIWSATSFSVLTVVVPPWLFGLALIRPLMRAPEMLTTLPLSGRTLVTARLTALSVYALLPTMAATLVFGVLVPFAPAAVTAANVGAALLLWLFLVQALYPTRSEVPVGSTVILTGMVGVAAVVVALRVSSAVLAGLYLAAAAVLAFVIHRQTPAALEVGPRVTPGHDAGAPARGPYGSLNAFLLGRFEWGVLLTTALLVATIVALDMQGTSLHLWVFLPLISTFVAAKTQTAFSWLDALPVARWRLLAHAVLPMPLAIIAGIVLGVWLRPAPTVVTPAVRLEFECLRTLGSMFGEDVPCHDQVAVPRELWRLAWNGNAPAVALPSGEQVRPPLRPLFWGVAHAAYNPYAVEAASSPAFVAHQMSRAIEAVYGVAIPAREVAERYLRVNSLGRVEIVGDGLTYVEDFGLVPASEATNPVALGLLCAVVWFVFVGIGFYFRVGLAAPAAARRQNAIGLGVLAVALGLMIALDREVIEWAMAEAFALLRTLLPSAPAAAWIVAVAVGAVLFLAVRPLFERLELAPTRDTFHASRWRLLASAVLLPLFAILYFGATLILLSIHGNASTGSTTLLRVQLLLGANAEELDHDMTPLLSAAFSGQARSVRVLLEHGARIDARDEDGRTALHVALSRDEPKDRLGTIRALLDHGADPNSRSGDGDTPLMDAVDYERTRILGLLLSRGADPDMRDSKGRTALERAVAKENKSAERVLRKLLAARP